MAKTKKKRCCKTVESDTWVYKSARAHFLHRGVVGAMTTPNVSHIFIGQEGAGGPNDH